MGKNDDRNDAELQEGDGLVRTTIVGGQPRKRPTIRMSIRVGLERVLYLASRDKGFRKALLNDREKALENAGLELSAGESAVLASVDGRALETMVNNVRPEARKEVTARLRAALKHDPEPARVRPMSPSGLVEMTRRRRRPPLHESLTEPCGMGGGGRRKTAATFAFEALRACRRAVANAARNALEDPHRDHQDLTGDRRPGLAARTLVRYRLPGGGAVGLVGLLFGVRPRSCQKQQQEPQREPSDDHSRSVHAGYRAGSRPNKHSRPPGELSSPTTREPLYPEPSGHSNRSEVDRQPA